MSKTNNIRTGGQRATYRRDRAKHGPTPKRGVQRRIRLRRFSSAEVIMGGNGWSQVISPPRLNRSAVTDAIEALDINDKTDRAELIYLANSDRTKADLIRHMDVFAARYPDDSRWDAWRKYRRTRNASLS